MADPTLDIPSLARGENEVVWTLTEADLGLSGEFIALTSPVVVELVVVRDGDQIDIRGRLSGEASDACARCGCQVRWPLEEDVRFFAVRASEDMDAGEDDSLLVHDGLTLELREPLRQTAVVSAPMVVLCRETCAGLCPTCGSNRNEETCGCEESAADPRWQVLSDVLKKTEPGSGSS